MTSPVDVLFLDGDSRVIESLSEIRPGSKTAHIEGATAVLELPSGTIRYSQTEKGDHVTIETVIAEVSRGDSVRRGSRLF